MKSRCGGGLWGNLVQDQTQLGIDEFLVESLPLPPPSEFFLELRHETLRAKRPLRVAATPEKVVQNLGMRPREHRLPPLGPAPGFPEFNVDFAYQPRTIVSHNTRTLAYRRNSLRQRAAGC